MDDAVKMFMEITQCDSREIASYYLTVSNGDVQSAINMMYSDMNENNEPIVVEDDGEDLAQLVSQTEAVGDPSKLTVLGWNIQGLLDDYLKMRTVAVVDIIKRDKPDVVMLQEVIGQTYSYIKSSLNKDYDTYSSPELLRNNLAGYFTALLVKRSSIQKTSVTCERFHGSQQGRDVITFQGKLGSVFLTLMVSHLESTAPLAPKRKEQLAEVFQEMIDTDSKHMVLFGADTNLRDNEVAAVYKRHPEYVSTIQDVWEILGKPADARYSWDLQKNDNQIKNGKARLRFERLYMRSANSSAGKIFKPAAMKFVGTARLSCGMFPSDHWGILTSFST